MRRSQAIRGESSHVLFAEDAKDLTALFAGVEKLLTD